MGREEQLRGLYAAFNRREAGAALAGMTPDVAWPNGWEGGWVRGQEAVRAYWRRQWAEIDPEVQPADITRRAGGAYAVAVHQVVRGLDGSLLADSEVTHVFEFDGDLVRRMTIEGPEDAPRPT